MVETKAEIKKEKVETEENQDAKPVEEMEQTGEDIDSSIEAAKSKEDDEAPFDINELLNQTIKLADGTEAKVFSYGPKTLTAGVRPLNCHLCRISNIWKKEIQKKHVNTNRHQNNLKRESTDPEKFNKPLRQYYGKKDDVNLKFIIYPGDNIPEVLEEHKEQERVYVTEEVKFKKPRSEEVLAKLKEDKINEYNTKMPLLGLEYIFKMLMVKKEIKRVIYYCALCGADAVADGYQHLAGATHQAGYIIKHFPGIYKVVQRNLNVIRNNVAREQAIRNVFRKLYRKIENSQGLKKIQIIDYPYFQQHRDDCIKICRNNVPHYDEKTIPINSQEVEALCRKALKGVTFIKPDLISLKKPELGYRRMVDPNVDDGRLPRGRDRDEPPMKRRNLDSRGGNMSAAWQTYRVMVGNILDEINNTYKRFEVEPKTHPHYDSEWQSFWRRRCQELRREKKDPRYHDFEAEWAPFWLQRLRNLYTKDLARRKHELKRMLDLPFDMGSPSPIRQNVGSDQQFMNAPQTLQQQQPAFITPNIFQDQPMRNVMENVPMIPAEPLSVISVMRLLSALEEQLGSLGPKAVQLLSRAVLVEKDNGHTDSLLIDNDYYVFFATVKEKFKGQILAKVADPTKLQAINNVIEEISGIIALMDKSLAIERRKQQQILLKQQRMKAAKLAAQSKSQELEALKTGNWQAAAAAGNAGDNIDASGNNRRRNRKRTRRDSKVGLVTAIENEDSSPGNNTASGNDNYNTGSGNDNLNRNTGGGGNDNFNRNTGGGGNDNFNRNTGGNFNRNAGGSNDNFNRNMNTAKDNFNRNTGSGNDGFNRNSGGGNDNFNRNSGGGNDNFNRNSGADNFNRGSAGNDNFNRNSGGNFGNTGNDNNRGGYGSGGNAGRNYGSGGNDNVSRNFGGNLDNNSRHLGGGNKDNFNRNFGNSGNFDRDFNDSGRGNLGTNLPNRNYDSFEKSFGGNDNNRNFGNDNFNRNDNTSRNYGGGNDNFNRNNDDYGRNYAGGNANNSSRNDFGNKNFGNNDNYGRNSLMGNDNFGRSFDNGNNRSNFGTNSGGGGANNSLGSNMSRSNLGGGLQSLGNLGGLGCLGNTGRNFSSGGGNDSGRNFGSGGFGSGFSSGNNFNRNAGFSRKY